MDPQKKEESEAEGVKKGQQEDEASTKNRVRVRVWDAMLPDRDAEGGGHLTIFYNGSICVCDDMTPAKAQAIMLIAAASSAAASLTESANNKSAAMNTTGAAANAAALMRSLSQQSSSVPAAAAAVSPQAQVPSGPGANSLCKLQAELPHARRHSLQQFMEKRRSRLVSKSPYASAKKSDEGLEAGLEGKPQLT